MKKKEENLEKQASEEQSEQHPVSDFEQKGWKEHSDGEVVKLEPGDSISGRLIDKSISPKYNDCGIYKLMRDDGSRVPKVVLGSKQLDRLMAGIEVGQDVLIVFEGTQPSDKGNPMKVFRVYTKDE